MSWRLAIIVLFVLAACGGPPPESRPVSQGEAYTGPWAPAPVSQDDLLVAEVGEQKIYASDVQRLARTTGQTARQATEDLIGQALLADEARRRGLMDDPEVVEAMRNARARVLIAREFAAKYTGPESVSMSDVEQAWKDARVQYHFNHPEVRVVHYYRFKAGEKASPEQWAKAKAAIEAMAVRVAATPPHSEDAFVALGDLVKDEHQLEVEHSQIWTTLRGRTVEEFADAAFAVPAAGQVGKPFRTQWGWEMIYLKEIDPERHDDVNAAAPEIRKNIFEASRAKAFTTWADGLVARHKVVRHDERLADITVDSPLNLLPQEPATPAPAPP
jgi:hypothetical protein